MVGVASHHWPARCRRLGRAGLGVDVVTVGAHGRVGVARDRFFRHDEAAVSAPVVARLRLASKVTRPPAGLAICSELPPPARVLSTATGEKTAPAGFFT